MPRKYTAGRVVAVEHVRDELRDQWNYLRGHWNDHLSAVHPTHDQGSCRECRLWRGMLSGVNHCIRAFGGRGWKI